MEKEKERGWTKMLFFLIVECRNWKACRALSDKKKAYNTVIVAVVLLTCEKYELLLATS
jgi:hypothetical protein